jgi:gamma-glutamylcyclotransferase (GGCT)/AIG2-like uncharacterized protein YtfP
VAAVKLFAYGTLTRRHRLEALCDRPLAGGPRPAVLEGYERRDTGHGYPMILPRPGARVEGLLWEVDEADLPQIDHYEGTDEDPPYYFRRGVRVETGEGPCEAVAYVGNPEVYERLVAGQG